MQSKEQELKEKLKERIDKKISDQVCEKLENHFKELRLATKENIEKYFQDLEKNKTLNTVLDVGRMVGGALGVFVGAVASATVIGAVGGVPLIIQSKKYLRSGVKKANRNSSVKGDLFSLPSESLALQNYGRSEISISICCGIIRYPIATESD